MPTRWSSCTPECLGSRWSHRNGPTGSRRLGLSSEVRTARQNCRKPTAGSWQAHLILWLAVSVTVMLRHNFFMGSLIGATCYGRRGDWCSSIWRHAAEGPVEFDLAYVPDEVVALYPGANAELLHECGALMLAMVAAWRWDEDDRLPNRDQYREPLLAELREVCEQLPHCVHRSREAGSSRVSWAEPGKGSP